MNQNDLIIGQRYVLAGRSREVATYEGKHNGTLTLADGSTYDGAGGALRFRSTDAEGNEVIRLFENGRSIEEPEAVKITREREAAERKARITAAHDEAIEYLTGLGLTVTPDYQRDKDPRIVRVRESVYGGRETADEIEVEDMTVGTIKALLASR